MIGQTTLAIRSQGIVKQKSFRGLTVHYHRALEVDVPGEPCEVRDILCEMSSDLLSLSWGCGDTTRMWWEKSAAGDNLYIGISDVSTQTVRFAAGRHLEGSKPSVSMQGPPQFYVS